MPSRSDVAAVEPRRARVPIAAQPFAGAPAATRTASAVDVHATARASGSSARRNAAHCASACGWETTTSIASSVEPGRGDERVAHRPHDLADDRRRPARRAASASSVASTDPSIEFSIGTTPRSAAPSCTAITTSCTVATGSGSTSPPASACSRAAPPR